MFESVSIDDQLRMDAPEVIDLGALAEAMLFYSSTTIVARIPTIQQLVTTMGADTLIETMELGFLKIVYQHNRSGIATDSATANSLFYPIVFNAPDHHIEKIAVEAFQKAVGKEGRGRRLGLRFAKMVTVETPLQNATELLLSDATNSAYADSFAQKFMSVYVPTYSMQGKYFKPAEHDKKLWIDTNLEFEAVNKIYHGQKVPHPTITPAMILASMLTVREVLDRAGLMGAELATSVQGSQLIECKIGSMINSLKARDADYHAFQDFMFDEGRSVAAAINSGERKFADVLPLLKSAAEFKKWIANKPNDANLVKDYHREVTKDSWVDKLPNKLIRWSMFSAAGLGIDAMGAGGIGTAAAQALSFADGFLLDKILKGWKPNQFVTKDLAKFVGQ